MNLKYRVPKLGGHIFLALFISICKLVAHAEDQSMNLNKPERVLYKETPQAALCMDIYRPDNFDSSKTYPAFVFYFGGGWNGGSISQFEPHAKYFASRGMITVLVDYRVKSRHKTTPYESVKDAKSSIRFLRQNAKKFNIDPTKIVASGGSAGGHLAAACATLPGVNEATDNLETSERPNALVLFNPVFDNGPDGFCYDRMGGAERYKEISPAHNITANHPPTIVFLGTQDHLIPVDIALRYQKRVKEFNQSCEVCLYQGEGHGFFNHQKKDGYCYKSTVLETDQFLTGLKIIDSK